MMTDVPLYLCRHCRNFRRAMGEREFCGRLPPRIESISPVDGWVCFVGNGSGLPEAHIERARALRCGPSGVHWLPVAWYRHPWRWLHMQAWQGARWARVRRHVRAGEHGTGEVP